MVSAARSILALLALLAATCLLGSLACTDGGEPWAPQGSDGPGLAVAIAALALDGVGDAVWDVRAETSAGQTVFRTRLTSTRFGDGAGSATYVGPCDASAAPYEQGETANTTVEVRLVGLYAQAVGEAGGFGDPAPNLGADPGGNPPLAAQDPGLMAQRVTCLPNEDTPVAFDVTVLRPASQGFLDLAVNFRNIFCSAKYDCDADPLLFRDGQRATTHVLGFACTGGTGAGQATNLYLHDLTVACSDAQGDPVGAPLVLGFSGREDGNQGAAPPLFYQWAIYSGDEHLAGLNKRYFNLALGPDALPAGAAGCVLTTRGTADGADGPLVDGVIPPGMVYPYIQWSVDLWSGGQLCAGGHALSHEDPEAPVRTEYTTTSAASGTAFAHDLFTDPDTTFEPVLDVVPGATVAYSVRLLDSSYTGAALRVRRGSDGAALDVGFTLEGHLDLAALSAFVGTGPGDHGFVAVWYDQSGHGFDAVQTTAARQPRIVDGGVLVTREGRAAVAFDGGDTRLQIGYQPVAPISGPHHDLSEVSVFAALSAASTGPARQTAFQIGGMGNGAAIGVTSNDRWSFRTIEQTHSGALVSAAEALQLDHQVILTGIHGPTEKRLYLDGQHQATAPALTWATGQDTPVWIGRTNSQTTLTEQNQASFFQGTLSELILYAPDMSFSRELVDGNMVDYFIAP